MRSSDILGRLLGSNSNLTSPVVFSLMSIRPSRREDSNVFASHCVCNQYLLSVDKTDDIQPLLTVIDPIIGPFKLRGILEDANCEREFNPMLSQIHRGLLLIPDKRHVNSLHCCYGPAAPAPALMLKMGR